MITVVQPRFKTTRTGCAMSYYQNTIIREMFFENSPTSKDNNTTISYTSAFDDLLLEL